MPSAELAAISQLAHFKVAPATSQVQAVLRSSQAETSLLVITQARLWECKPKARSQPAISLSVPHLAIDRSWFLRLATYPLPSLETALYHPPVLHLPALKLAISRSQVQFF